MKRPRPKSRLAPEVVRVTVRTPRDRDDDEPPGYSGHNGGSFNDAGYRSGTGTFGFYQHVITS